MIGLDSYSRQVFIYLDPILICISLWIDCLFEIRKIAVFPLAFIAGWLQGHWWGFISRNYVVWPTFFLMNVFIALKGSRFWLLFNHGLGKPRPWLKFGPRGWDFPIIHGHSWWILIIYYGVKAETRPSQMSVRLFSLIRWSTEQCFNNLNTSLWSPCRCVNLIRVYYFSSPSWKKKIP